MKMKSGVGTVYCCASSASFSSLSHKVYSLRLGIRTIGPPKLIMKVVKKYCERDNSSSKLIVTDTRTGTGT
jgi:hypothetical protein